MNDIKFRVNTNDEEDLKAKLAKHGLDLDFEDMNIPDGIFYNGDLRSYCGVMLDYDFIVMIPEYIPEYMEKLRSDPDFIELGEDEE